MITNVSTFAARTIAHVISFEQSSTAGDEGYLEGGELVQFHAEEVASDDPHLPANIHALSNCEGRYFLICDQYGSAAGCLAIYDEAATFCYSIITG
jgi:hypothetical protein